MGNGQQCQERGGSAGYCRKYDVRPVVFLLAPPCKVDNLARVPAVDEDGQLPVYHRGPTDGLHADGGSRQHEDKRKDSLDNFQPQVYIRPSLDLDEIQVDDANLQQGIIKAEDLQEGNTAQP